MSSDTQLDPIDRTLLDVIAAITELLAGDSDTAIANTLMDDLTRHDPEHLVPVFAGVVSRLVQELATEADVTPQDVWRAYATQVSTHIAKENDHE